MFRQTNFNGWVNWDQATSMLLMHELRKRRVEKLKPEKKKKITCQTEKKLLLNN